MSEELTEKEIRDHFKHMCESGYDPLLCYTQTFNFINLLKPNASLEKRTRTDFVDRVITEDRYYNLIKDQSSKLDDIIFIPFSSIFQSTTQAQISGAVAIFWLYPSGCRTLKDLFKKYEKKIKGELNSNKNIIIP